MSRRLLAVARHNMICGVMDAGKMVAVYASIIRPHLEYASAIWDPHLTCDYSFT